MDFTVSKIAEADVNNNGGRIININGIVHNIRQIGNMRFIILRKPDSIIQCVFDDSCECIGNTGGTVDTATNTEGTTETGAGIGIGDSVRVTGTISIDDRAPNGFELTGCSAAIYSKATEVSADISKRKLNLNPETLFDNRPVTLRNLRERAIFKLQEGIAKGFRCFLDAEGFTEIHSPKLVSQGAEGGSNIFKLDYFGRKAYLTQSPQLYKQMMVSVFERVFEIAPVFRAEKHSTSRHLNEYISMDFELGFIDSFYDIIKMQTAMLKYMISLLNTSSVYREQIRLLDIELPEITGIPSVKFSEAKRLVSEAYKRPIKNPYDLEPDEEQNISRYFKEAHGTDFVFVTHYPAKKRPFYAMDDPEDPKYTLSFDLLYKGTEITTGGQRIHDYARQVEKMERLGMDIKLFDKYLMLHKNGVPPHGGLGMGLERFTAKLAGFENVRRASLFPRDMKRLEP